MKGEGPSPRNYPQSLYPMKRTMSLPRGEDSPWPWWACFPPARPGAGHPMVMRGPIHTYDGFRKSAPNYTPG